MKNGDMVWLLGVIAPSQRVVMLGDALGTRVNHRENPA
jgi:hypothetical protein